MDVGLGLVSVSGPVLVLETPPEYEYEYEYEYPFSKSVGMTIGWFLSKDFGAANSSLFPVS